MNIRIYWLSSLMLPATLNAAEPVLQLDPVEVISTATRTEQPIQAVSASVQVITQKDIEKTGAQTLKDVISNTPGLTLQYGTFPAASAASKSSVSLRGVGATGTLWLLDGRRLAGEVKNPYDMDRIPASAIERIEIVKGPMSALYGADAVGGVINIITKKPKAGEVHGEASASYGANQDGDADSGTLNASVRGGSERVRYSFSANYQDDQPYTETEQTQTRLGANPTPPPLRNAKPSYAVPVSYREQATISSLNGKLEFDLSPQLMSYVEMNWFEEEREGTYRGNFHPTGFSPAPGRKVPAFDVPVRSRDDNKRLDMALGVEFEASEQLDIQARIYQSDYHKRNQTTMTEFADFAYPSEAASSASGMNANAKVKAFESSATWYSPDETHILTGGVEWRDENREATVFTQGNDLSTRAVNSKAIYLQDEWRVTNSLRATMGGRYDEYNQDSYTDALGNPREERSQSKTTFRLGLNQAVHPHLNLRANFAQGFRVPDIRELYIQKQTPAGMQLGAMTVDPVRGKVEYDLQPESTNAFEIGASGKTSKLSYDLALFYNQIKDRIEQVQLGSGNLAYFTSQNVSKAKTQGLELNLRYALSSRLHTQFSWSELDTENKETGKDLVFIPQRHVSLALDWQATTALRVGAQLQYTGKQFYQEQGTDMWTDDFTMLNLNADYRLSAQWEIFGGIRNLTDTEVDKRIGSDPGRFIHLGIRTRF